VKIKILLIIIELLRLVICVITLLWWQS